MARRDAIHQRWLVLLRAQPEDGLPAVAEAHGADLLVLLPQGPGAGEDLGLADVARVFRHVAREVDFVPFFVQDGAERQGGAAEEVGDVDGGVGLAGVVVCQQAHVGEGPA